jgi:hypothetical protein
MPVKSVDVKGQVCPGARKIYYFFHKKGIDILHRVCYTIIVPRDKGSQEEMQGRENEKCTSAFERQGQKKFKKFQKTS